MLMLNAPHAVRAAEEQQRLEETQVWVAFEQASGPASVGCA